MWSQAYLNALIFFAIKRNFKVIVRWMCNFSSSPLCQSTLSGRSLWFPAESSPLDLVLALIKGQMHHQNDLGSK